MSDPYVGEIRMVGFNFAPQGWAFCDGSLMSISQNEVLFTLIGTTYGGDGQQTFALPDLRGRRFVHAGTDRSGTPWVQGQVGGTETVTLTAGQLPAHTHPPIAASTSGTTSTPSGTVWAGAQGAVLPYSSSAPNIAMNPGLVDAAGQGLPHENMAPFLVINFVIALFGIFPSQN